MTASIGSWFLAGLPAIRQFDGKSRFRFIVAQGSGWKGAAERRMAESAGSIAGDGIEQTAQLGAALAEFGQMSRGKAVDDRLAAGGEPHLNPAPVR